MDRDPRSSMCSWLWAKSQIFKKSYSHSYEAKGPKFWFLNTYLWKSVLDFCHTRAPSWFSAKLKILQLPACKMEPRSGYIMQLEPPTHHIGWKSEAYSPLLLCLSPPFMSVPTYYVCHHLLCLSPPYMSVPTFYGCPHFLCLTLLFMSVPPFMSVPTHYVCPLLLFCVCLSPPIIATLGSILDF